MITFIVDMFRFPFERREENRFNEFLTFCFKDYPVYFWVKPSFKRFLLFFVLAAKIIWSGYKKNNK